MPQQSRREITGWRIVERLTAKQFHAQHRKFRHSSFQAQIHGAAVGVCPKCGASARIDVSYHAGGIYTAYTVCLNCYSAEHIAPVYKDAPTCGS